MIYKSVNDNDSDIPRKNELIGKYLVKNDKKSNLTLNDDGTYSLIINVCDNYYSLSGSYELRDTKLVLLNNTNEYEDLKDNKELNFTILNDHKIKNDENLVCISQETLFEK